MFGREQGQKRSRPDAEPRDEDCRQYKRVSEVLSDSTCNSDLMLVERIHSGLPALPDKQKTEGAFEAAFFFSGNDGNRAALTQGCQENGFRLSNGVPGGGPAVSSMKTNCAGSPQFHGSLATESTPRSGPSAPDVNCRPSTSSLYIVNPASVAGTHGPQPPRASALSSLSYTTLQQQMTLLLHDEQALLRELRAMRRRYDARVAAITANPQVPARPKQPHQPKASSTPALPPRLIPARREERVIEGVGRAVVAPASGRNREGARTVMQYNPENNRDQMPAGAVCPPPKHMPAMPPQGSMPVPPPPPPTASTPAPTLFLARPATVRVAPPAPAAPPLQVARRQPLYQGPARGSQPMAAVRQSGGEEPTDRLVASLLAGLAAHDASAVEALANAANVALVKQLLLAHSTGVQQGR